MSQQTKIYGVIGDPIKHSLSPALHNAGFQTLGLDAEYKLFPVTAAELPAFFERLRQGEINGVNVTLPHKQAALKLCDDLSPEAAAIGAVNTVVSRAGRLYGDNTDCRGYMAALTEDYPLTLPKLSVVVIGAGGAGLSVAYAFCQAGVAALTIANRDVERARNLIARLQMHFPAQLLQAVDFQKIRLVADDADLIVNATSLGLAGRAWPDLSFLDIVPPDCLISDIVYRPRQTELLQAASARGLKTHPGLGMLLQQGALAFELFTGQRAPVAEMRQALETVVGP